MIRTCSAMIQVCHLFKGRIHPLFKTPGQKVQGRMLKKLKAHRDAVCSVNFSNDGNQLVSGSSDGSIRLWCPRTGELKSEMFGHTSGVNAVAISPDGSMIASASDDNSIKLWQTADGCEKFTLSGHGFPVYSVTFSPDGNAIASGSFDKTVRIWPLSTLSDATDGGKSTRSPNDRVFLGHSDSVFSVAYSSDGSLLTSCGRDKRIIIWSVEDGVARNSLSLLYTYLRSVAFSPDGTVLAAGCGDSRIILSALPVDVRKVEEPDAPHLASCSQTERPTLAGHAGAVMSVAWSPDGTVVASGSGDCTVRLWCAASGAPIAAPCTHAAPVLSVAFAPSGLLAAADDGGDVILWDLSAANRRLAVAMALHSRLGAASRLSGLEPDLLARVASTIPLWA